MFLMRMFAHNNSKTLILISILTASLDPTHDPVYKHLEEIFGKKANRILFHCHKNMDALQLMWRSTKR